RHAVLHGAGEHRRAERVLPDADRPPQERRDQRDLQFPSTEVLGCTECDKQQYYPESLISGQNQNDADIVGRLDASGERFYRFGIGMRPIATPLNDHNFRRAAHDVSPGYDPEYITEGV